MGLFRLLLALSVVLAHEGLPLRWRMVNGDTAVQAFFIVSGFYMTLILTRKYRDRRTFFVNRFLRLFPVYWIVLAMTALWSLALIAAGRSGGYPGFGAAVSDGASLSVGAKALLIATNVSMLGQDLTLFLRTNAAGGLAFTTNFADAALPLYRFELIPQAWSLSIELVFYAMVVWLVRWPARRLIMIVAATAALRASLLAAGLPSDPWSYRFLPCELGLFVMGVVAYRLGTSVPPRSVSTSRLLTAGLIAFVLVFGFIPEWFPKRTLFCLYTALVLSDVFALTEVNRTDRYIGELSYPLYLVHLVVIEMVARLRLGVTAGRFVSIAAALALAAALHQFVQRRVDRFRAARVPASTPLAALS